MLVGKHPGVAVKWPQLLLASLMMMVMMVLLLSYPQVAAFGPAAARTLLFLGHIQEVSVSTWPAGATAAVRVWHASLATQQTAQGRLRVGECFNHNVAALLGQLQLLAFRLQHVGLHALAETTVSGRTLQQ